MRNNLWCDKPDKGRATLQRERERRAERRARGGPRCKERGRDNLRGELGKGHAAKREGETT